MPTILVVDDDPDVRRLAMRALQSDGYQVDEAVDGRDAQDQFALHLPDLVLTDLHMPGIDGEALTHWIRAQHLVPIVVITADVYYLPGDTPVLTKPFTLQELRDIVRNTLLPQP